MKQDKTKISLEIEKNALQGLLIEANTFFEDLENKKAFEAWKNTEEANTYADFFNS